MTKFTVNLQGGLGNQLFQIMFLENMAHMYDATTYYPNVYKLDKSRHTYYHLFPTLKIDIDNETFPSTYNEPDFTYQDVAINPTQNYKFNGYFQSYKYFKNMNPYDFIKVSPPDEYKINTVLTALKKFNLPLVSLHVRRGDYLNAQHFHNILGVDYYKNAVKILQDKGVKDPLFVIFSEDVQWCQENLNFLKNKVILTDMDYIELFTMAKCDHNIISNSSFSWWGAYLNQNPNKIIIRPTKWFQTPNINTVDLCPHEWLKCEDIKQDDTDVAQPVSAQDDTDVAQPVSAQDDTDVAQPVSAQDDTDVAQPVSAQDNTDSPQPVSAQDDTDVTQPVSAQDNTDVTQPVSAQDDTDVAQPVSAQDDTDVTQPVSAQDDADVTQDDIPTMNNKIYAIGDSHSIIFHKSKNIIEHWMGFGGNATDFNFPLTMYRLGQEGLDVTKMPERIGNGHEKYVPQRGDTVIFCYGYNDAHKNIHIQSADKGRAINEIVDTLVTSYLKRLSEIQKTYGIKAIPYPVIPPTNTKKSTDHGEPEDILLWTNMINNSMKKYSPKYGLCYMDGLFAAFMDDKGFLKLEYTKPDQVHLVPDKCVNHLETFIMEYLTRHEDYGFIVPSCVYNDFHVKTLEKCITSIRRFHPTTKIVIIRDFTSTYDINMDDKNIHVETHVPKIPADMLTYYFFYTKKYFQKAVVLQDSMELLQPMDPSTVNNIKYIWHFTNHRVHWDTIQEPATEYNAQQGILSHNDLVKHCINKYIKQRDARNYCLEYLDKKDNWSGCFGCLTVMSLDFLKYFNSKTDIIHIMTQMTNNRYRRAIESVFSLLVQYTLDTEVHDSYMGLYYDGVTSNNGLSPGLRKTNCNRNNI